MDWKQMWEVWFAASPDCFLVRVAGYVVFSVFVPVTALLYIFTSLVWG